jgi:hypothetical protein
VATEVQTLILRFRDLATAEGQNRHATTKRSPLTAPSAPFFRGRSVFFSPSPRVLARQLLPFRFASNCGTPNGIARVIRDAARACSIWLTETSSWMIRRTKSLLRSATPVTKSSAKPLRVARCTSRHTKPLPKTNAARVSIATTPGTSLISSSWTSATGAVPRTIPIGGTFSNTFNLPISLA